MKIFVLTIMANIEGLTPEDAQYPSLWVSIFPDRATAEAHARTELREYPHHDVQVCEGDTEAWGAALQAIPLKVRK